MIRLPGEKKKPFFFLVTVLPFANLDIENLRKLDISKTLSARSFKLGQLIEDNE